MKFSESWLRSYVNPPLDSAALAHILTMAGLEVEALEILAPPFSGVVVGRVEAVTKHPDADRLNVCQVNVGQATLLQIVCGANNVKVGIKAPCALVGAVLPNIAIKQAKVRGVESFGMLCSEQELGLAESADGLLILADDAPIGALLREYLDLDDQLFTLKLTPNRSDCLSVSGIAREVAAITESPLTPPAVALVPQTLSAGLMVDVQTPQACPRYCGRIVQGVNPTAVTPEWMQRRLLRSGLRPISAIVDVTNYVLLELGQPLHAFDLSKLRGDIIVRMARPDESLTLLNDQMVNLQSDMLVIADVERAIALAGIMGGAATAVDCDTRDVFLESAFFSPDAIAGRARRLGLATDSSHRFERGVDFAATRDCLERATQLLVKICGGAAGPITEVAHALPKREPILLRVTRVRKVLGLDLSHADIQSLLGRLQLVLTVQNEDFSVTPPSYRFDLAIEEDLIEEIARLYGYDNIPAVPPRAQLDILPQAETLRPSALLSERMVARDYQEVITYSFVEPVWETDFADNLAPLLLKNPIASQLSAMRSTLWGGLIETLRFNLNRKQARVRLFELGKIFLGSQPEQQISRIGGLGYGSVYPEQWGSAERTVDFFDVKNDVEALLWPVAAEFAAASHPALHPGQSARISINGQFAGWLGALHPKWTQKYALPLAPILFEVDAQLLLNVSAQKFAELPKFQPIRRDLAVIVAENLTAHDLLNALRQAAPKEVIKLGIFDLYVGKGIDSGKKSIAIKILLQDTQKTMTDLEVDTVVTRLTQVLSDRFGAKLR